MKLICNLFKIFILFELCCICNVKGNGIFTINQYFDIEFEENLIGSPPLSPVILVPGDGGSQMDARLNKSEVIHYICQKHTSDFFNVWLNLELLVPLVISCWIDNVKLNYDNVTRTTSNQPGVEIRIPGWGSSETVEWLDPSHASAGAYFKDIGNVLVSIGYKRNVTIRGAPYDFRKAPNENAEWFVKFKALAEETYQQNGNVPITLIAHSMGGPMSLLFLQRQTQAWKDKHIARMVTLSGAFGGSAKAVKVWAIGDDLGSYFLNGATMRAEQITNPSLAWLMPSPIFWKSDEVLVRTKSRNYTYNDMEDFLNDLGVPHGWEMMKDTIQYSKDFTAPGVEVHCLYGQNIPTVEMLHYTKSDIPDGTPDLLTGDGDGTVNLRSLLGCKLWEKMQKQPIKMVPLPNVDHMGILSDAKVIKYISDLLKQ